MCKMYEGYLVVSCSGYWKHAEKESLQEVILRGLKVKYLLNCLSFFLVLWRNFWVAINTKKYYFDWFKNMLCI